MLKLNWRFMTAALFFFAFFAGCAVSSYSTETGVSVPSVSMLEPEDDLTIIPETVAGMIEETEREILPTVSLASFSDETGNTKQWYQVSRLIYHACGAVDEMKYTNSREAIETTLSKGNMLIEVDFLFTSDGHLVCAHKWYDVFGHERSCTLEEFQAQKIQSKYSSMTAADIIAYMEKNPSLYIIVDTKETDVTRVVAELLRLCDNIPEIADRFVIQLYDKGVKQQMRKLYPFRDENFLFTCYKFGSQRVGEILDLCREEKIQVVTVRHGSWGQQTVDRFLEEGIILFEHTVNLPNMAERSLRKGIYGFYTDCLQVTDLNTVND